MMQILSRRRKLGQRGFTLIELLIVVAIIAILAAILIPNFLRSRGQSRVAATKGTLRNIGTALESYFVQAGAYPASLAALSAAGFMNTPNPTMPNGTVYGYTTGTTAYVVCDNATDAGVSATGTSTTWYYTPGGLASIAQSGTTFPTCPTSL